MNHIYWCSLVLFFSYSYVLWYVVGFLDRLTSLSWLYYSNTSKLIQGLLSFFESVVILLFSLDYFSCPRWSSSIWVGFIVLFIFFWSSFFRYGAFDPRSFHFLFMYDYWSESWTVVTCSSEQVSSFFYCRWLHVIFPTSQMH